MGIEKKPQEDKFLVPTHECAVLHQKGVPFAAIIDENSLHKPIFEKMSENPSLQISFRPQINEAEKLGHMMSIHLRLKTDNEYLEFTFLPSMEFNQVLLNSNSLQFIIPKLSYGFTLNKMSLESFDELVAKYIELKQQENTRD